MTRLLPCLMFVGDQCGRAEEAVELYVSAFERSRVIEVERVGPEGESGVRLVRFEVAGQEAVAMDSAAAHQFTFTPAISLIVDCEGEDELDRAWAKLAEGGEILMPLQEYDFSPKFGWVQDRFGVSWQLRLASA